MIQSRFTKKVKRELRNILADKTSGSSELLERINLFCSKNLIQISNPQQIISLLKKHFTSFQNIQDYLESLQSAVRSKQHVLKHFDKYRMNEESVYSNIYKKALPYLKNKKRILTISNSKTVYEILRLLITNHKPRITICESRPQYEGRLLAKKLSALKVQVQLITEAQAAEYINKCDCVLIGADTILKNGDVINKVGSLQLAILSKYYSKPFYVIADKSKFSNKNKFAQRVESQNEIWKGKTKKIFIKNYYFEKIPRILITKILSD